MTLEQLLVLATGSDVDKIISTLGTANTVVNVYTAITQYNPKTHTIVTDKAKRPDKAIKDDNGNLTRLVAVARLPLAYQKKIVDIAAAFLGTPTVQCKPEGTAQTDFLTLISKIWDDNKLDYKFNTIATYVMSEKECAEIWYVQDAEQSNPGQGIVGYWEGYPIDPKSKFKLGMKLLANSLGDKLYPVFDVFGDMIAFGRGYKTKDAEGKEIDNFDLYTADNYYLSSKEGGSWKTETKPNIIKKIPIIYYSQPLTEWDDVQELIDRMEVKKSNQADTNDYTDQPILVGKGDTISLPDKGESGKYVELKGQDASLNYLQLPGAPEAMKLEMEGLNKDIHGFTHTPDISFESVKGLGQFSGIALKMLFLDPHMKAAKKIELFGEGLQRRLNYIKKALSVIDTKYVAALPMVLKPKFELFLPKNIAEEVKVLIDLVAAGLMTMETAVKLNPLIANKEAEIAAIKAEAAAQQAAKDKAAADALALALAGSAGSGAGN